MQPTPALMVSDYPDAPTRDWSHLDKDGNRHVIQKLDAWNVVNREHRCWALFQFIFSGVRDRQNYAAIGELPTILELQGQLLLKQLLGEEFHDSTQVRLVYFELGDLEDGITNKLGFELTWTVVEVTGKQKYLEVIHFNG